MSPTATGTRESVVDETPAIETRRFWIGTTIDAPCHNITLGGVCFPRHTRRRVATDNPNLDDLSLPRPGCYIELTDVDLEKIKESCALRVVRWGQESEVQDIDAKTGRVTMKTVRRGVIVSKNRKLTADEIKEKQDLHLVIPQYRPEPGEIPVGCYVYMVPIDSLPKGFIPGESDGYQPPTLVPRDSKLKY